MKKINAATWVLALSVLWSGMVLAADPLSKSPSQKQSPGASKQPESKTITVPTIAVPTPFVDLSVTEIRVQEIGQGALIHVAVKNVGTATANANLYQVRILLDGSPLPMGDQPLFNAHKPIEPNQTRVTGIIPSKSGRTEVTARLVPSGAAAGDNPTNNILTRILELPEVRPDFSVKDISLTDDNRIKVTIRNSGGYVPRNALGTVELYVNNRLTETIGVSEWPNPMATIEKQSTKRMSYGASNVRAIVNPERTVLELSYENNTLTKEFKVEKPDLIVRRLERTQEFSPYLSIVIANIGRGPSVGIIKADVFKGDRLLDTITQRSIIRAGGEVRLSTRIPCMRGVEYRVVVDPQNEIDEEREDNNSLTQIVDP